MNNSSGRGKGVVKHRRQTFDKTINRKEAVMNRHQYFGFICFFVVVCFLAPSFSAQAQQKVITLKYAIFWPPVHRNTAVAEEWAKELEKRTNGRVEVKMFPGATLAPPNQTYEAVVRGIADIGLSVQMWTSGRFPLSEVLDLPLGITNALQATMLCNAFYKKFKPKEYDDTKVMYLLAHAPGLFLTVKPLAKIDELKGVKIRTGGNNAKIAAAMGAVPVSFPTVDMYDGIQRGVIEGTLQPYEVLKGFRIGELIRGAMENSGIGYTGSCYVVMNKAKWNSLPPDIQQTVEKLNEEWMVKHGKTWSELDEEGKQFGLGKGMKITKVSPEEVAITVERMRQINKDYVESMKGKGLPGDEALKFCLGWVKAHP